LVIFFFCQIFFSCRVSYHESRTSWFF
jgi:hypothetical protein